VFPLFVGLVLLTANACGTDAERKYAGLSRAQVALGEGGYVLRYLSPPWQRAKDDPLETGARKSVPIGGTSVPILAGSGAVLEIDRESNTKDVEELTFPNYRLEAALVECDSDDALDTSCAEHLAILDYAARQSEGRFDLFGDAPRAGKNDADQDYYELMGQSDATARYSRVIFFAGDAPERVAARVLIEANPDLGEREITEMVRAFEMLPGDGAEP
jgi:hypothetical protein